MMNTARLVDLKNGKIPKISVFLLLFLVCLAVYSNALNNDFIFEDRLLIVENTYIKDPRFIGRIFNTDIFHFHPAEPTGFSKYYRPLQSLSYSLDYFIWQLNPAGFRLTNILIHSLNSFLLFLLVSLVFKENILALLSALFFSLHPANIFNVAYLSPRSSLLETFFMLSSIIVFFSSFLRQNKTAYLAALFLFILAVLSREAALLTPLFIAACALFLKVDKKKLAAYLIPYILLALFYFWLRSRFLACDKLGITPVFLFQRIGGFIMLVQRYFSELILPVGPAVSLFGNNLIAGLSLFIVSSVVMVYLLSRALIFRDKAVIFVLLFYLAGLLPVINVLGSTNIVGSRLLSEHYLYIPAMGFCVLLAYALVSLARGFLKTASLLAGLIIFIFSLLVMTSNTHYKDEIVFYNYLLKIDPGYNLIRTNLGNAYYKKGDFSEAARQAQLVLSSEPGAWDAYLLLGNIYRASGDLSRAEVYYKKTILLNPASALAFNNLALVCKESNRNKEAYENFKKALGLDPESALVMNNLADLLIKEGSYDQALVLCRQALRMERGNLHSRIMIGVILAQTGHFKEAEISFQDALEIKPDSVEAMRNLGTLYGNAGDFDRAIALWRKALSLNPGDAEAQQNIKEAEMLKGRAK